MPFRNLFQFAGRCLVACCAASCSMLWAAVPAEQLLPANTKGAIFIPNWEKLETAFDNTQLGQLMQDPVMQPFVQDLKAQIQEKGSRRLEKMGVTLQDLQTLPGGEIAVAITLPNVTTAASLIIVDVTGHEKEAQALREKIAKNLTAQGGQVLPQDEGIARVQLPRQQGETTVRTAVNLLKKQTLILSDNLQLIKEVSRALDNPRADSLASTAAFKSIKSRIAEKSTGLTPHVSWFLEPFGYTDAMRIYEPQADKPKGPDLLKLLRNQGFAAIQGIGGNVNFSTAQHELLHRTFIYAPGNPTAPANDRFSLGARLLDFPATKDLHVQTWIPREIATYSTFNWNLRERFAATETLADEYIGQKGGFRDILDSIETEPNGPKVSIEREIIANLSQRVTMMTDYQLPITPKSERLLFAVEIDTKKNNQPEQTVANAIERMMRSDDRVRRLEHNGIAIWESVPEKATALDNEIEIEIGGGASGITTQPTAYQAPKAAPGRRTRPGQRKTPGGADEKEQKILPNSAVAVANGHLYIASHTDILIKVLTHNTQIKKQQAGIQAVGITSPSLDSSTDITMVLLEMEQGFKADAICFRHFSRTDEEFRPTYELIRNGQMPKSETMFGKILNGLFGDGKPGSVRDQKIDGSKLPDFDVVRRYLGPAGAFMTVEKDGWFLSGFTLRKTISSAKNSGSVQR